MCLKAYESGCTKNAVLCRINEAGRSFRLAYGITAGAKKSPLNMSYKNPWRA